MLIRRYISKKPKSILFSGDVFGKTSKLSGPRRLGVSRSFEIMVTSMAWAILDAFNAGGVE